MNIGSPHAEEKEGGLQKGEEVGAVVARHAHAIAEGLAKPRDRNKVCKKKDIREIVRESETKGKDGGYF
eukprot:1357868-Amorphochlora_amoeboformis.AAC.1